MIRMERMDAIWLRMLDSSVHSCHNRSLTILDRAEDVIVQDSTS